MTKEDLIIFFNKYNINELDMMKTLLNYAFRSYDNDLKEVMEVFEKVYNKKINEFNCYEKIVKISSLSKKINKLDDNELVYFEKLTDEAIMFLSSIYNMDVELELKDISILDERLLLEIEKRKNKIENSIYIEELLNGRKISDLSFLERNMYYALVESLNSNDPNTKVGVAYISFSGELLSVGYNKTPNGWDVNNFPWNRDVKKYGEENTKYPYIVHAEMDGLINYKGNRNNLINATAFVTLFPCPNCAKLMIQNGISRVVYKSDKYNNTIEAKESRILFEKCHIEVISFDELINENKLYENQFVKCI